MKHANSNNLLIGSQEKKKQRQQMLLILFYLILPFLPEQIKKLLLPDLSTSFDLPKQGQELWARPTEWQPSLSGADVVLKP